MFFRRKGRLRREFDENLLGLLDSLKQEWTRQKNLVDKSVEPSLEVIAHLYLTEAKYFYVLKEAKKRPVKMLK
jgi:Protein of unknown function (DUF2508)